MVDENSSQHPGMLGEVEKLKSLAEEITTSLRSQRDILKTRGLTLPPMTMQVLTTIVNELNMLEHSLTSETTELGQLRSLADNAAMINSSLEMNTILTNAMDVIISLTGAERGYIILRELQTGDILFPVRRENELAGHTTNGGTPQISMTIVREVLDTGTPMLTDNAYKDERLANNVSIAALTLRSVLCVPLNYKGEIIGAVYVDNRLRTGVFEQREKTLLVAFANQAAVAMENARLYAALKKSLAEITEVKDLIDNVFESIGSGVITIDIENLILTLNRAAAAILARHDRGAVLGKPLKELLSDLGDEFAEALGKVQRGDEKQVFEGRMAVAKRDISVNMKLSPLKDAGGNPQGSAIVLDDVTEQREREEMLTIMKRYLPPEMVDNIHSIARLDLGGERREVTCMFVDVRSIASMPTGLRPPQIMEMVNVYLSRATECIHQVKGVIDKYMGTDVMGLFNSQLNPMQDHAAQAVEAALLIRDAFVELYAELGLAPDPHYYRLGINSGVATLGNVGSSHRRDFTAIGDTINLSKRLEENATPGQMIISEYTLAYLEASGQPLSFRYQELEPIQAKGRQQKTRVYEIFRL